MSVPPQTIRVKRKRNDEAPVEYLQVQEVKRHRSDAFVYQRQNGDLPTSTANPLLPNAPKQKPVIHTSDSTSNTPKSKEGQNGKEVAERGNDDAVLQSLNDEIKRTRVTEPRRFHMSRQAAALLDPTPHAGISKKRSAATLFVERRTRRPVSRTRDKATRQVTAAATPSAFSNNAPESVEVNKEEQRRYKRPGVSKMAAANNGGSKPKPQLPPSMMNRRDMDLDKLTAEMNAYTLEQIGLNIKQSEDEKKALEQAIRTPSKLKPKAPAKRFAERHPEIAAKDQSEDMDVDLEVSDADSDDYVIETYIRIPATKLGAHVSPQQVGLLVFDTEPDIDFFYGGDSDSDEEFWEDEDDENAEGHYTADYPDDELDSDDGMDQHPYSYRTGNASDKEEYGIDDDAYSVPSDDEDGKVGYRPTFGRKPWMKNQNI